MKSFAPGVMLSMLLAAPLSAQVVFVDVNATGAGNGSSWSNAYTSLQPAITAADAANQQVWVADGTYTLASQLNMADGVEVYGGFEGAGGAAETLLSQRNPSANVATLDFAAAQRLVFSGISNAALDGFTLTQLPTFELAIALTNANAITLAQLTVPDLGASYGVVNLAGSTAEARRLFVRDDGGAGGAASGVVVGSTSTLTLENSVFTGWNGIGVQVSGGGNVAHVLNSTFHNVGWGLRVSASVPSSATNCIFTSVTAGYAVHETTLEGDVVLGNCLFFGNGSVDVRDEGSINVSGAAGINAIPGNEHNRDGDPVYTNAAAADFRLGDYSAAIDQGDDTAAPIADFHGTLRLDNPSFPDGPTGISDIGAYEAPLTVVPVELSTFSVE